MAKYLLMWEVDKNKIAVGPKERGTGWMALLDMTKQDIDKGIIKEWGAIVGEVNGYCVVEGNEIEIGSFVQRYVPFVFFKAYPAASFNQVVEIVKNLIKA
ncbi:MAG: hypothetical protein HY730_10200 [Candidatus Tectomicrobia bacterium]|uniref:DUF3303 domain-containing protein n=1 Tax=Tectimicrobiota bacterium TaxID=2528274 RepID=A0A933GP69_UNCTE|nr:hypothetical protein [Candidatus Tectomicrobia bacterium]